MLQELARPSSERQISTYCMTGNCRDCFGFVFPLMFSARRPCRHDECHEPGGYGNMRDPIRAFNAAMNRDI